MPSTRSLHPTRVPRSSLAFGLLLSLVAACGAKPPGDIETSTAALSAGPLTFYTP